jgi:hypothetical protein
MKKTMISFMTVAAVFAVTGAIAQTTTTTTTTSTATIGRTTFGVRAGINFQTINGKNANGNKLKYDLIPGFNAGVNVEIPIAPDFYVQPGLLFTTRGSKYDRTISNQTFTQTVHLSYLEIPVNLVYKPLLGTGHLIAGIGPYVDFGVGGNVKYEGAGAMTDQDVKFKNEITASDNDNYAYYRRVGAGANVLFGYEFANKLSFQLNAQLGLTDINPKDNSIADTEATAKHTGFGISAGYRF